MDDWQPEPAEGSVKRHVALGVAVLPALALLSSATPWALWQRAGWTLGVSLLLWTMIAIHARGRALRAVILWPIVVIAAGLCSTPAAGVLEGPWGLLVRVGPTLPMVIVLIENRSFKPGSANHAGDAPKDGGPDARGGAGDRKTTAG